MPDPARDCMRMAKPIYHTPEDWRYLLDSDSLCDCGHCKRDERLQRLLEPIREAADFHPSDPNQEALEFAQGRVEGTEVSWPGT